MTEDIFNIRNKSPRAGLIGRCFIFVIILGGFFSTQVLGQMTAGVAKADITDRTAGLVNDPLYAKALVLDDGATRLVIITLDVVAIENIGPIQNGYLSKVRERIEKELNIPPSNVLINVSHCHGIVRDDEDELTIKVVTEASQNMVPVTVGSGKGLENRISENRRVKLKNGAQADMRRAYSFPPDEEVLSTGPIDPQIGILRLDKYNGQTLAVVYNFAVHPIQGVPNGGNTADIIGFASKTIEDNTDGAMALFLQGCGGDINPVGYKAIETPPNAETLGNLLGLSVLKALKEIPGEKGGDIKLINEKMDLPRADFTQRIELMEAHQAELIHSLKGTNINLKTFISLLGNHNFSQQFPSAYSYRYLNEEIMGSDGLSRMDSINRKNIGDYRNNIYIMEELTRLNENLSLIRKHQRAAAGRKTIEVEVVGIKISDYYLVTFPGELTVQIGLNIKKNSPHENTFVAGYTNGYIYYAPTSEQLNNTGAAQEDSETVLSPEWQHLYEEKVSQILEEL